MHINKLQGVPQKTRWRKKASESRPVGIQNHLARDVSASEPTTRWVTAITYLGDGRRLVISQCRKGFVFRCHRGLVHEPVSDTGTGHSGGPDGAVATSGLRAGHSAF